jgi:hypothetical protein
MLSTSFANNRLTCEYKHIITHKKLAWDIDGFYKMFNPSITKWNDNYVLCVRYSNKTVKNFFMYAYSTLNYQSSLCCAVLDGKMKIQKVIFPIRTDIPLEDPRIQYHQSKFYISVTEYVDKGNIFPTLYILNDRFDYIQRIEYDRNDYFTIMPQFNIQKNWCPFVHNGELYLHTDTYPMWNVFKLFEDGHIQNIVSVDTKTLFCSSGHKLIRCSTSWKKLTDSTYICGSHTKTFCTKLPTIRTILVEIDMNTLQPIRKSDVLCIDIKSDTRIQFLSGLEVDEYNVYLSYGIGDYKCEVHSIPKTHVHNLLHA